MDIEHTWTDLMRQLKSYPTINASQIDAFFSRVQIQAASPGFIMLTSDNAFIKDWIEKHYLKDIQKLIGKEVPVAGGHMFETVEVKEAVAEKKKAIKEESKRRNMFGSKRDGSFWRNKKRTAAK